MLSVRVLHFLEDQVCIRNSYGGTRVYTASMMD